MSYEPNNLLLLFVVIHLPMLWMGIFIELASWCWGDTDTLAGTRTQRLLLSARFPEFVCITMACALALGITPKRYRPRALRLVNLTAHNYGSRYYYEDDGGLVMEGVPMDTPSHALWPAER